MKHYMLKVLVTSFTPEPGGMLSVSQRENQNGQALQTHSFPAGVVKDFELLHDKVGRIVFIPVLNEYVERHNLKQTFS